MHDYRHVVIVMRYFVHIMYVTVLICNCNTYYNMEATWAGAQCTWHAYMTNMQDKVGEKVYTSLYGRKLWCSLCIIPYSPTYIYTYVHTHISGQDRVFQAHTHAGMHEMCGMDE